MTDTERDDEAWGLPTASESEWDDEDEVLDLRAIAPPRKRVQVTDDVIVTLRSPREFGARDQARLQQAQQRIAKLQRGRLTREKADELAQLIRDVTRMILADPTDEQLDALTDNDMEGLVMVFTARWAEYLRKLSHASGGEDAARTLAEMGLGN